MKNRIELDFNGKNLTFFFGLGFMGELLENLKCSIDELQAKLESNPFKIIPELMHTSYAYGFKRQGKEVELSWYLFLDFLDDNGGVMSENVNAFLEAFKDSMTKDVPTKPNKIPTKGKAPASLIK